MWDGEGRLRRLRSGHPLLGCSATADGAAWNGLVYSLLSDSGRLQPGLLIEGHNRRVLEQLAGNEATDDLGLAVLRDQVRGLLAAAKLPWTWNWIPAEENGLVDHLTRPDAAITDTSYDVPEPPEPRPGFPPYPPPLPAEKRTLRLYVVGESSPVEDEWGQWNGRKFVIAASPEEALEVAGGGRGAVAEIPMDAPRLLTEERAPDGW